jgi:hypothetical protein
MVTLLVSPPVTGGVLTREQETVPADDGGAVVGDGGVLSDGGAVGGDGGVLSDIIYMLGCNWVTVPDT